jgi:hypothetical protein
MRQEPHGVTSQKTAFFIVTPVKTSNLTNDSMNFSLQEERSRVVGEIAANFSESRGIAW